MKKRLVIILLTELIVVGCVTRAESDTIGLWGRFETQLDNDKRYTNPFKEVELNATFISPSGKSVDFFGFYDGDGRGGQIGKVWKLRFMPDEIGIWSYTCRFSDGTPGKRGEFTCVDQGAKPGPLQAAGRWLKFAGGKWFYPRSYYFSEVFSGKSPHWEKTVDTLFGGRCKYNFCCTTFWQGRLLEQNRWNNIEYNGFYPIYDKDCARLDLRSWRHVDEVLQHLESHDVVWFNFDGFVPVYAQEVCWEADSKLNAEQMRKGAWGVVLASGLLNYAEMFEGPSQGRPENYGDGKAIPYLEIMFDFLQSLPYPQMAPHNEMVNEGCLCFAEPASAYVCYTPDGETIRLNLSSVPGRFSCQWFNPRDGSKKPATTVEGGDRWSFRCPDPNDGVLYLRQLE